jgi:hypothetical protein
MSFEADYQEILHLLTMLESYQEMTLATIRTRLAEMKRKYNSNEQQIDQDTSEHREEQF